MHEEQVIKGSRDFGIHICKPSGITSTKDIEVTWNHAIQFKESQVVILEIDLCKAVAFLLVCFPHLIISVSFLIIQNLTCSIQYGRTEKIILYMKLEEFSM